MCNQTCSIGIQMIHKVSRRREISCKNTSLKCLDYHDTSLTTNQRPIKLRRGTLTELANVYSFVDNDRILTIFICSLQEMHAEHLKRLLGMLHTFVHTNEILLVFKSLYLAKLMS